MAVKTLTKFNPKCFEATGKNQRKLHIEVSNHPQIKCIECDINKRRFLDRNTLSSITPSPDIRIRTDGVTKLAAWIARSYTRIALPDLLVERLRPEIFPLIKLCIDKDGSKMSSPIHESILFAYIDWQPREDSANVYEIKLLFLCDDTQTTESLEILLEEKLEPYRIPNGKNGVKISNIICRTPDTTFLSDITVYERFSEWDFLSDLAAISYAPATY